MGIVKEKILDLLEKILDRLENIPTDEYISELEKKRDVKRLIKILPGKGWSNAAESLGRLRAKEAVEPLIGLLTTTNDWARYAFIKTLGEIGDPRAIPALQRCLSDEDSSCRSAAGNAIAKIQSSSSSDKNTSENIESLIAILVNNKYNWETRENSATTLSKLGKPAVIPLCRILTHYDSEVRWQAAEALGIIKDKQALEPLIPLLNDSDHIVQMHTALAIGKLGDKRGIRILINQLENFSGYVVGDAIDLLGDFQDTIAVEPLIKMLDNSNNNTRERAAIALGKLHDKRAIEPLNKLLQDRDEKVKEAARTALISLNN
jgi:HEAT repeat protein